MITDEIILDFLDHLEKNRNNISSSRNQRLAAIKSFFRFLAFQDPTLTEICQRVCKIRAKKTEHKVIPILDQQEVKAILDSTSQNTTTLKDIRDYALIMLIYNTGARVQEIVDLQITDLTLNAPFQVLLTGKGNKQRLVPLYRETIEALKNYLMSRSKEGISHETVFLNSNGQPLTRFGILHIIKSRVKKASKECPPLKDKTVSVHMFRHTTVLHMVQAGVDISVIKQWLGHADIKTTSLYLEINIDMKRQALEKSPLPQADTPTIVKPNWHNQDIMQYLDKLSKRVA
jgi:site-specific recombinase XerD